MSRKERRTEKTIKIFCEGDTEYNYFEYMRKNKKVSLAIRPVNMKGGGYSNFLQKLQEDANSNCMAKVIVIDGDRALSVPEEDGQLKQLVEFCNLQNESQRIPHILIVDFPDFEYVACLHSDTYHGQNVEGYIKKEFGYRDIDDFKSDEKVYKVLAEEKGSIEHLCSAVNQNTRLIENEIEYKKKAFELRVCSKCRWERLGMRGTNFTDFYRTLDVMGISV